MNLSRLGNRNWNDSGNESINRPSFNIKNIPQTSDPTSTYRVLEESLLHTEKSKKLLSTSLPSPLANEYFKSSQSEKHINNSNIDNILPVLNLTRNNSTQGPSTTTAAAAAIAPPGTAGGGGGTTKSLHKQKDKEKHIPKNKSGFDFTAVLEKPPNRADIKLLELEFEEKIKEILIPEQTLVDAYDSGKVYQPFRDGITLLKTKFYEQLNLSYEDQQSIDIWLHTFIKSQCLMDACDHSLDKLVNMLTVISLELGTVLRKVRLTLKQSYNDICQSWYILRELYTETKNELMEKNTLIIQLQEEIKQKEESIRQGHENELTKQRQVFQQEKQALLQVIQQREYKIEQLSDTLRSLNGILKSMQNTAATGSGGGHSGGGGGSSMLDDYRDRCARLEDEIEKLDVKAMKYDHLQYEYDELAIQLDAKEFKLSQNESEITYLKTLIMQKDEGISQLMEKDLVKSAEIEKLTSQIEKREKDLEESLMKELSTSVLCVRCKKSLDDVNNLRLKPLTNDTLGTNPHKRYQCETFRILLPNMRNKLIPIRSIAWLRKSFRAILLSKLKIDVSVLGVKSDMMRFPQYTYAWFERAMVTPQGMTGGLTGGIGSGDTANLASNAHRNTLTTADRNTRTNTASTNAANTLESNAAKAMYQSDEDRWAFYYSARSLSREHDPEGMIIWSLLDEYYSEDGLTFLCHCMSVLLSVSSSDVWSQFDECSTYNNNINDLLPFLDNGRMTEIVWIHIEIVKHATRRILSRALESHVLQVIQMIDSMVVVPQQQQQQQQPASTTATAKETTGRGTSARGGGGKTGRPSTAETPTARSSATDPTIPAAEEIPLNPEEADLSSQQKKSNHINVFLWLRLMLKQLQAEQIQRQAAIRLMFETASIGALFPALPASYVNRTTTYGNDDLLKQHVEYPQFHSICKALFPPMSSYEISSLYGLCYRYGPSYHDEHDITSDNNVKHVVNSEIFLKMIELRGLYSRHMKLDILPMVDGQWKGFRPRLEEESEETVTELEQVPEGSEERDDQSVQQQPEQQPILTAAEKEAVERRAVIESIYTVESTDIVTLFDTNELLSKFQVKICEAVQQRILLLASDLDEWIHSLPDAYQNLLFDTYKNILSYLPYYPVKNDIVVTKYFIDDHRSSTAMVGNGIQAYIHYKQFLSLVSLIQTSFDNPILSRDVIYALSTGRWHQLEKELTQYESNIFLHIAKPSHSVLGMMISLAEQKARAIETASNSHPSRPSSPFKPVTTTGGGRNTMMFLSGLSNRPTTTTITTPKDITTKLSILPAEELRVISQLLAPRAVSPQFNRYTRYNELKKRLIQHKIYYFLSSSYRKTANKCILPFPIRQLLPPGYLYETWINLFLSQSSSQSQGGKEREKKVIDTSSPQKDGSVTTAKVPTTMPLMPLTQRQVLHDPWYADCLITEIYLYKIRYDQKVMTSLGSTATLPLARACIDYFHVKLSLCPREVIERAIYDFFYSLQMYRNKLTRMRLFYMLLMGEDDNTGNWPPTVELTSPTTATASATSAGAASSAAASDEGQYNTLMKQILCSETTWHVYLSLLQCFHEVRKENNLNDLKYAAAAAAGEDQQLEIKKMGVVIDDMGAVLPPPSEQQQLLMKQASNHSTKSSSQESQSTSEQQHQPGGVKRAASSTQRLHRRRSSTTSLLRRRSSMHITEMKSDTLSSLFLCTSNGLNQATCRDVWNEGLESIQAAIGKWCQLGSVNHLLQQYYLSHPSITEEHNLFLDLLHQLVPSYMTTNKSSAAGGGGTRGGGIGRSEDEEDEKVLLEVDDVLYVMILQYVKLIAWLTLHLSKTAQLQYRHLKKNSYQAHYSYLLFAGTAFTSATGSSEEEEGEESGNSITALITYDPQMYQSLTALSTQHRYLQAKKDLINQSTAASTTPGTAAVPVTPTAAATAAGTGTASGTSPVSCYYHNNPMAICKNLLWEIFAAEKKMELIYRLNYFCSFNLSTTYQALYECVIAKRVLDGYWAVIQQLITQTQERLEELRQGQTEEQPAKNQHEISALQERVKPIQQHITEVYMIKDSKDIQALLIKSTGALVSYSEEDLQKYHQSACDMWRLIVLLLSEVQELCSYLHINFPRDPWKSGNRLYIEKSVALGVTFKSFDS